MNTETITAMLSVAISVELLLLVILLAPLISSRIGVPVLIAGGS